MNENMGMRKGSDKALHGLFEKGDSYGLKY